MNILKRIKDYLSLKSLIVDESVTPIVKFPTEAIDEREMAAKKEARINFAQQEQVVMERFAVPHDVGCGYPVTKCKMVPCFIHEPDQIIKKTKVKRSRKSVPIDKRFLE